MLETSFLKKFKIVFFQHFQFKSHNCNYEDTKALTECYGSDDLQKWSRNISRQNAKRPYIIWQSNLLPEFFIFHNPGLCQSKKGIVLSRPYLATIFLTLINAHVSTLVKFVKLGQNQFVNKLCS